MGNSDPVVRTLRSFRTVAHEVTHSVARIASGKARVRRFLGRGRSIGLIINRSRWRGREQETISLDMANLFTVSTYRRHPRILYVNIHKRAIRSTHFHNRREWQSSINLNFDMSNTDTGKV